MGGVLAGSPKCCVSGFLSKAIGGYGASPAAVLNRLKFCWQEISGLIDESGLRETE